ncbi:MAG: D-alanine--D-alanine ligase [Planctomycetota bacterium]|nr:MAG: D-alanine--D-alanine ligase [Planctomycetota bacterium]
MRDSAFARPLRVAVLMGGRSSEREVSLRSGAAAAEALAALGHEVIPIDVSGPELEELQAARPEVAFVALHGRFGEDGGVQRRCEQLGIPYTGSGPEASARAFDKAVARRRFAGAGLAVPEGLVVRPPLVHAWLWQAVRSLGGAAVCKPAAEGSSIGVHLVRTPEQLAQALAELEPMGGPILLERYIAGRELTVAVLGESALPVVEVIPRGALYDYRAKYDPEAGTRYHVDPPLSEAVRGAVVGAALAAHRALGCEGLSRVDMRLDTTGRPVVLEVNTIPGLTRTSLLPKAAAAAGIGLGQLCERLLAHALARAGRSLEAAA